MADNPTVDNGALTDYTVAADDDGTALHQYVKLEFGADNTQTKVSAANPLPVTGTVDLGATDNAVLDAIAASVAAIDIDATTIIGHVDGIEGLLTTIDSDTSTLAVVGGGVELTALRVTLASDSTGVLSVDDNGGSLTVDGTFWQATQPISAASLPLPTGASTAAKQPALGTAGTASADVITIQGIASMTAVKVDGSGVTQPVSGTVAVTNASLTTIAGAVSGTEMQVDVLTMPTVTVNAHAVTNAGTFAVQVDGAALTALQLIDNLVLAEDAAHVTADPGIQMLAVRKATPANVSDTDGDYEPLQISAGRLWASTVIDTALPAGTNAIGKLAANSGVDIGDVDVLSIAAGDNNIGNVDIVTVPADPFGVNADAASATGSISAKLRFIAATGIPITGTVTVGSHAVTNAGTFATQSVLRPETSGGLTIFRSIDIDETEEEVKATAGQVYAIHCMNLTNALLYLKFYNLTAANTTVGTSTPVLTFPVPGNNDSDGAGFVFVIPQGIAFGTAISVAATTGIADADTGAPAANACTVQVLYA